MLELLKNCSLVITDSGGLQKEAFFNKKHCIVVREQTEWVELVDKGFAKLVGADAIKMNQVFQQFKGTNADFSMNLFGNEVGGKIYDALLEVLRFE